MHCGGVSSGLKHAIAIFTSASRDVHPRSDPACPAAAVGLGGGRSSRTRNFGETIAAPPDGLTRVAAVPNSAWQSCGRVREPIPDLLSAGWSCPGQGRPRACDHAGWVCIGVLADNDGVDVLPDGLATLQDHSGSPAEPAPGKTERLRGLSPESGIMLKCNCGADAACGCDGGDSVPFVSEPKLVKEPDRENGAGCPDRMSPGN